MPSTENCQDCWTIQYLEHIATINQAAFTDLTETLNDEETQLLRQSLLLYTITIASIAEARLARHEEEVNAVQAQNH